MKTKLAKKTLLDRCSLEYLPINLVYEVTSDGHFDLCYEALDKGDIYTELSDWFGGFLYDSTGIKHLTSLICVNDNLHTEFKKEYNSPLHISEVEVDVKFRDSNFDAEHKLHSFSKTLKVLEKAAKDAGYDTLTLQAIDLDKVPKYEHIGFKIKDMSDLKEELATPYYKEHPFMVKEI